MLAEQMSLQRYNSRLLTRNRRTILFVFATIGFALISSCTGIDKPKTEPFYAQTSPPAKQEFRWSNGKSPNSFDPAKAASAPETDIVRALFEGLTEIDPTSLKEVPAAAEKWSGSDDLRVWTFHLRKDARWSNGQRVTADDFVSSWKRLAALGDKAAHRDLFQNVAGLGAAKVTVPAAPGEPTDFLHPPASVDEPQSQNERPTASLSARSQALSARSQTQPPRSQTLTPPPPPTTNPEPNAENKALAEKPASEKLGVEAVNDTTLKVTLDLPDRDFPKLVANPIFSPIYGDGAELESDPLDEQIVTNGPFTVTSVGKDGIALSRSDTYWNKAAVDLEHVRFVPHESAEAALEAYRRGEVDAVTNAEFEPLALKLLTPYEDFRQTTYSALNFYEFNAKAAPFSDRRVREALAIAIDRERLTDGELEGAAEPATSFLPLGEATHSRLLLDVERAKQLLEKSGFPNGQGFPVVRLLVNRNDTQVRVAKAIAKMWKQNISVDTLIIVKDSAELASVKASGEYDLVRRGIVLPTVDESVNLESIFGFGKRTAEETSKLGVKDGEKPDAPEAKPPVVPAAPAVEGTSPDTVPANKDMTLLPVPPGTMTEEIALFELNAIPLYFPMSYSLVKPYVKGFETNGLDAPLLKDISIDNEWKPKAPRGGF